MNPTSQSNLLLPPGEPITLEDAAKLLDTKYNNIYVMIAVSQDLQPLHKRVRTSAARYDRNAINEILKVWHQTLDPNVTTLTRFAKLLANPEHPYHYLALNRKTLALRLTEHQQNKRHPSPESIPKTLVQHGGNNYYAIKDLERFVKYLADNPKELKNPRRYDQLTQKNPNYVPNPYTKPPSPSTTGFKRKFYHSPRRKREPETQELKDSFDTKSCLAFLRSPSLLATSPNSPGPKPKTTARSSSPLEPGSSPLEPSPKPLEPGSSPLEPSSSPLESSSKPQKQNFKHSVQNAKQTTSHYP